MSGSDAHNNERQRSAQSSRAIKPARTDASEIRRVAELPGADPAQAMESIVALSRIRALVAVARILVVAVACVVAVLLGGPWASVPMFGAGLADRSVATLRRPGGAQTE